MTTTDRTTHLGQGLTVGQVEDLRQAAAQAGDDAMVAICDDALECDRTALARVKAAIAAAEAPVVSTYHSAKKNPRNVPFREEKPPEGGVKTNPCAPNCPDSPRNPRAIGYVSQRLGT